jgi:hypothetical protein
VGTKTITAEQCEDLCGAIGDIVNELEMLATIMICVADAGDTEHGVKNARGKLRWFAERVSILSEALEVVEKGLEAPSLGPPACVMPPTVGHA